LRVDGVVAAEAPRTRALDEPGLSVSMRRWWMLPLGEAGAPPETARCAAENVVRAGALASPPPPGLPGFSREERGLIPLGRVAAAGGERVVAVRVADTFFAYVAGRSRFGKTELALAQFLHLVRSGHGGLFLDPHADALARLRPHLTEPGVRERVVEIDLANPSPDGQPGWNLFDLSAATQAEAEARVDALVDALASALRWDERNTRALTLATQAASALAHLARRLPPELCPTIFQLPTLLSEERFRDAALPHLPEPTRRFFTERFPRLPDEAITPVTNLIDRLRASTPLACLLGQGRPDRLPALEAELAARRRPAREVLAALDELDERILAALERPRRGVGPASGRRGGGLRLSRGRTSRDGEAERS
jgi:hypothetical protein